MLFNQVIGQESVKQHLTEMIQYNRLSHALLFLSKEGAGGLAMALAFAQYITCEKVQLKPAASLGPSLFGDEPSIAENIMIPNDACGVCASCTKSKQFIHPDIHFSFPVITRKAGEKPISNLFMADWREFIQQNAYASVYEWLQFLGAENKQGNITAEECNDIIRKLSLKSFESECKILIMWLPEFLGKSGNKLLKLIEEPPANTIFILVAENEEQILPTILSRCQLVKIPRLKNQDIKDALIERSNVNEETAQQISGIAEGNYNEALQLLQHTQEDWQQYLKEWLNAAIKTGPLEQTKWVEDISRLGREKQKQFLRYFNHLLEQSIRLRIMGSNNTQMASSEFEFAKKLNKISGVSQQQTIIEEIDKATYHIERNANPKMLFMALTIKLHHIIHHKTLILAN